MTHKQRVLQLLSDNEPHSHMELYRLGVMAHSRVADLRKEGYEIKCWAEGGQYLYQLFGAVQTGEVAADGGSASSAPRLGPPPTSAGGSLDQPPSPQFEADSPAGAGSPPGGSGLRQLSVFEAAA